MQLRRGPNSATLTFPDFTSVEIIFNIHLLDQVLSKLFVFESKGHGPSHSFLSLHPQPNHYS